MKSEGDSAEELPCHRYPSVPSETGRSSLPHSGASYIFKCFVIKFPTTQKELQYGNA